MSVRSLRRVSRRLGSALLLCVALHALALPGAARADGDPASDVLLGSDLFLPYAVAPALEVHRLLADTAALKAHGVPLRVALVGTAVDLGAVPQLFGHPRAYARFLAVELSYYGPHRPLLVVMPGGYGTVHLKGSARSALATLPAPSSATPRALIDAAIRAEVRIARSAGFALPGPPGAVAAAAGLGHGRLRLIVILGTIAGLGAAGLLLTSRRGPRFRTRA